MDHVAKAGYGRAWKGRQGVRAPAHVREFYYELRAPVDIGQALAEGYLKAGYGMSRRAAAARAGTHEDTARKWDAKREEWFATQQSLEADAARVPRPKALKDLSKDAKKGLKDFGYFCSHYLDLEVPAFFLEMARVISRDPAANTAQVKLARLYPHLQGIEKTDLLPAHLEEGAILRLLILIFPGVGKTTLLLAFILWKITKERAAGNDRFAVTYGQRTDRLAQRGLRQIKDWMTAQDRLIADYGQFQPDSEDSNQLWTRVDIAVAGMGRGKEATLAVWASGASIRGVRPNLAVWDDIIDTDDVDPQRTKEITDWWDDNPARRVEPGGTLVVVGNRVAPNDFYSVLEKRRYTFAEGEEVTQEQAWHVVKYRAHDLQRCPGNGTHPAYPVGCLLWPARWSWKELERVRQDNPPKFAIQFQLDDEGDDETLVPELWIRGGAGDGDVLYAGCLDLQRDMWDRPQGLRDPLVIGTLDPSPTAFAAAQLWAYESPFDHLIAVEKRRMRTPDYAVLIAEWTMRAREIFGRFDAWIVEKTGSQYLHQSKEMEFLWGTLGVVLIPHETQRNKRDPEYGVWSVRNQWRWGRVRVPYAPGPTREYVRPFIEEHQGYPFASTADQVMAGWFYQAHKDGVPRMTYEAPRREVPSWLRSPE